MIITFCGHKRFYENEESLRLKILKILSKINEERVDFYLGGYGGFDILAKECAFEYKKMHPKSKVCFISPYLTRSYLRKYEEKKVYDEIIFAEIENTPPQYAIIERNKWMVKKADVVIAYVKYEFGGAYKTYEYAKKKGKIIYNLCE